jgi:hypothetical protein
MKTNKRVLKSTCRCFQIRSQEIWRYVSLQKPRRHSVAELSVDRASITSPKQIPETLIYQFLRVFTIPDRDPLPNQPKYTVDKAMSPITVSKDNIEARLKNLHQKKFVGPDTLGD